MYKLYRIYAVFEILFMAKAVVRGKQVPIRLTDELYQKLCKYSDRYGQAPSVMAAIGVAAWVEQQERVERQMYFSAKAALEMFQPGDMEVAMKKVESMFGFKDEDFEEVVER